MNAHEKHNKIKERSITCSHNFDINTSKYVYLLDTHSVKVWWGYMLLDTNAIHYCDIFSDIGQCFRPAQTKNLENQKIRPYWPLHKLVKAVDKSEFFKISKFLCDVSNGHSLTHNFSSGSALHLVFVS